MPRGDPKRENNLREGFPTATKRNARSAIQRKIATPSVTLRRVRDGQKMVVRLVSGDQSPSHTCHNYSSHYGPKPPFFIKSIFGSLKALLGRLRTLSTL